MKVHELSKEIGATNKELIAFLKNNGCSISSHMQNVTDEMIDLAHEHFSNTGVEEEIPEKPVAHHKETAQPKVTRVFNAGDEIICKSVTPWKLTALGVDKKTVYHWEYFGDIDYVKYRDLQALRRTEYITKPKILIMDKDLRAMWGRELKDTYKYFEGIEYPEEFFDKSDEEFQEILNNAPVWLAEIIKSTAITMIRNENYPSVSKIVKIDDTLGTCIKDFL